MKVNILKDERYPDFVLEVAYDGQLDIPHELYDRYVAAVAEYDAVQDELRPLWRRK